MSLRIGLGYDAHRLVPGRPLVLGGVTIPFHLGLKGHSDADVLCHAVGDALLGALALGDLGTHFPPEDPAWRNISSLHLLERIRALVEERGGRIVNVDSMLILEAPRIAPHVAAMREKLAGALAIPIEAISVKATTNERLGWIGRGEGAAAQAVALLSVEG